MDNVKHVKHAILVMSGKGGVGKSSITVQLALYFSSVGLAVGVLDADLCGPSIPKMLGITARCVEQGDAGWLPIPVGLPNGSTIKVMSMAYLLPNYDDAVIWRGPKKTAMIDKFLHSVDWGDLDILLVDTPPGTSDEHISVIQGLHKAKKSHPALGLGALVVSTPQVVSLQDVDKQIAFCRELQVPILGVVENLSGYICKQCAHCNNVFSSGGGLQLAEKNGLRFLGRIPIVSSLAGMLDDGSMVRSFQDSAEPFSHIKAISEQIRALLGRQLQQQ